MTVSELAERLGSFELACWAALDAHDAAEATKRRRIAKRHAGRRR